MVQVYNDVFTDATPERTELMFNYLDPDNTGYVDYLGWSQSIKLQVCLHCTIHPEKDACIHVHVCLRGSSLSCRSWEFLELCHIEVQQQQSQCHNM